MTHEEEDYLIRRYGELNPKDWIFSDPSDPGSKVYDDGSPLPPGKMPINLAPRPLEGELISTPSEPPRDHVIVSYSGYVWLWSEDCDSWLEVDSQYGDTASWEDIYRWNRRLTIYKPVRKIA